MDIRQAVPQGMFSMGADLPFLVEVLCLNFKNKKKGFENVIGRYHRQSGLGKRYPAACRLR